MLASSRKGSLTFRDKFTSSRRDEDIRNSYLASWAGGWAGAEPRQPSLGQRM